jgi:hypothetical protein
METGLVQLIAVNDEPRMCIPMIRHQSVEHDLGHNGKCKKHQVQARHERPYRSVVSQNSL